MPEYIAQSPENSPVKIHTGSAEQAAALYVRSMPAGRRLGIEQVTVTDPAGLQTQHDIDTATEMAFDADHIVRRLRAEGAL